MLPTDCIEPDRLEPINEEAVDPNSLEDSRLDIRDPTPRDRQRIERARQVVLPAIDDVRGIEARSQFFVDESGAQLRIWFLDQVGGGLSRQPVVFLLSAQCLAGMTWKSVGCFQILRAERSLERLSQAPVAVLLRLLELHLLPVAILKGAMYQEIKRHWGGTEAAGQDDPEARPEEILSLGGERHKVRPALEDPQQVPAGLDLEVVPDAQAQRFEAIRRDLESLLADSDFISEKLGFLMNILVTRLNLIDNRVGNILSAVALVFLPLTLIGSIYGMRSHRMPELDPPWVYPLALAAMLTSAVVPYLICKWKRSL